ncbi:MAG: hypothetical protein OQK48_07915 [Sulfurimonas sp.]|uniref:hypothetical protein n=1 Tax=Sulfurimonas sp. TaxID=2022749 RepID=UPI002624BCC6|nr:hypothetical protein [Sulfurimonas sp.]MCW8895180.1 hypothetical protein [Sulfurimonas sp.]MCW8954859.1 hypothetical protein [Sulfurimonas sp.]
MKTLIILAIPFILFASGQTMSISDYMFFTNADKRPFKQLHEKSRMQQLNKVDEKEAENLVKKLTQEDIESIKLTRSGKYLIYKINTQNYKLIINALDATVIEKKLK